MAFAVHWRSEFSDIQGEDWRIDILEDSYGGAIVDLTPSGSPLMIDWPSDSDDIYEQNIRGSMASIGVYSTSSFQFTDLFTSDNLEYKVNIYYDTTTLYWTGWVTANNWSEPYTGTPYPVTISAVDGLGLLKDFAFSGHSLTSRQTLSKIIYDIIGDIGFTQFTEYINVYESEQVATTDDSPLDQTNADPMLWEEDNSYDALSTILKCFNATIIQSMGTLVIYRYKELSDATMRGRIFTSATAKSSTTNTPLQYVNRPTQSSNFIDNGSGTLMLIPQVKTLEIVNNCAPRDSILLSWDFDYDDFSGTYDIANWTETDTPDPQPVSVRKELISETKGVLLHSRSVAAGTWPYISQSVDLKESTTDTFSIELKYGAINDTGGALTGTWLIEVTLNDGTDTWYLGFPGWTTTPDTIYTTIDSESVAGKTWTGWQTYSIAQIGCKTGTLLVKLYSLESTSTSFYGLFKDFKIRIGNQNNIIVEDIGYTVTNAVNGQIIDLEYNLGDGDSFDNNTIMERGALGISLISLTNVAADFVSNHAATYLSGGVVVTSSGADIIFTSDTAGTAFTGSTAIANKLTNLSGSVVNTQANVVAVARIDTITIDGTSGRADITCNAITKTIVYSGSSPTDTAANFVTSWSGSYLAGGVVLTSSGADIIFTAQTAGTDFTGATTIVNDTGDLDGTVVNTQANVVAVVQIDTITLTGATGAANIVCDGTTKEASFNPVSGQSWDTRGGSENDPIVELIGGEIGGQFARPKHLLDLELYEVSNAFFKLVGNLQDVLNQYSAVNRVFLINRAGYDIRNRKWNLSLNELI